jgi:cytochrome P450
MSAPQVDLTSAEFLADPYPTYRRLREHRAPVYLSLDSPTGGMWLVTRYEDVAAVLREPLISKDLSRLGPSAPSMPLEATMLFRDPPDHSRMRSLANQAFTPKRVKDLEARIEGIANTLIDQVESQGSMDLIADFAMPLPIIVIAEMLGVPAGDRDTFRAWSNDLITGSDMVRGTDDRRRRQGEAVMALMGYFGRLIAERREQPRGDIISALIEAQAEGTRMTEEELLGTCILLLVAGHETTVNLFGNGLLALLRHPDQLALLQRQPELLPSAVEEMLRYESPVQRGTFRVAIGPVEIGGTTLGPGDHVSAVLGAANRDPDQFPDPDRFDITRSPNRHLAFGEDGGPHRLQPPAGPPAEPDAHCRDAGLEPEHADPRPPHDAAGVLSTGPTKEVSRLNRVRRTLALSMRAFSIPDTPGA